MTKRKKNPPPHYERTEQVIRRHKKRRRTPAEAALNREITRIKYNRQARALRSSHLFGELFNAKNGVDFRKSPDDWTPQAKRRITMYWEEMAPRLSSEYVVKRYFRKDRLQIAAEAALQGNLLPGQKAVAFSVDKGQTLEVKIDRKNRLTMRRDGVDENKLFFDMVAFAKDAVKEVNRVLDTTKTEVFKIITGKNESKNGYTRSALIDRIERWVVQYAEDDPDKDIAKYDKWLFGLIGYPGLKTGKKLVTRGAKHAKEVKTRQRKRLARMAREKRAMTKAQIKRARLTGKY